MHTNERDEAAGVLSGAAPVDAEVGVLLGVLDGQRRHVRGILDGLDVEALRRPVLPSGWSCLGLVRHLALDVERFWFQAVFAGDAEVIASLAGMGDAWQVGEGADAGAVLERYRVEARIADRLAAGGVADAPLAWWPGHFEGEQHLDAARELIDGRRWLVLT
ncbi:MULTISPECIES: DinB family protein [Streptomyces]|uniref:DinB family protein n=1 Tax=Streptomyces TaxID=1883 RepID=UPI00211E0A9F|nr:MULTISPECIES: DinB family protein [Streptomyces]MCQ9707735.1 DinB family protein [Streptomyces sp. BSP1]UYX93989.1 DinB family protein [Streptomyces sp. BI87]